MSTLVTSVAAARGSVVPRRGIRRAIRRRSVLAVVCILFALLLPANGQLGAAYTTWALSREIGGQGFRLGSWEMQALGQKARDLAEQPGADLTPAAQHDLVVNYFDAVGGIEELGAKIEGIYADPSVTDPRSAAAPFQAKLDALLAEQANRRPAVERILEGQSAAALREAGLTTAGRIWPPVSFQFTESPLYLIVSPRNRIALEQGIYLDPSLSIARMEQIESQVQVQLDVSALVEDTGGFSSYPTMVIAYPNLEWVLSTIAHEWAHTYLVFRPLGWHYYDSSDTRTLNETAASIAGDELARLVMLRFYPERVPPAPWPRPLSLRSGWWASVPEEQPFEFGPFMRETRLHVDELLSEGRTAEAEGYMEARRRVLVQHGYAIRKLNQAYFAFHGSYAVGPGATDPIGGKLRALRQRSASLAAFVQAVSHITSVAELDDALKKGGGRP